MPLELEPLPVLSEAFVPPVVRGTADLTEFAYSGNGYEALIERVERYDMPGVPRLYDRAIACQLAFRRAEGLDLLNEVLAENQVFRIAGDCWSNRPLRVLAVVGPGDLMTNAPLDFITNYLDIRLDLLYVLPNRGLPACVPDHDVAFFALGDPDGGTFRRLCRLFRIWPRPALNDPGFLPALARDALPGSLAEVSGICSPTTVATTTLALEAHLSTGRPIAGFSASRGLYPCIIRPTSSHAGSGLARITSQAELAAYLRRSFERDFFVTAFEDYKSTDGLYRKYRVVFIDRQPFLCHMAVSEHWMVHYLNAGMSESAAKRAEEANAMAEFDNGFGHRHAAAFAALHDRLGFDYYSIDCAETPDGRLLVFEADAGAIIHMMDPPELFPYKPPQMRRVFSAFGDMLQRASLLTASADPMPLATGLRSPQTEA